MSFKPNKKVTEEEVQEVQKPQWRYVCHGCTNDALVSTNRMVGIVVSCQVCKKQQITVAENWLPL